jgi:hypothetical protein
MVRVFPGTRSHRHVRNDASTAHGDALVCDKSISHLVVGSAPSEIMKKLYPVGLVTSSVTEGQCMRPAGIEITKDTSRCETRKDN